MGRMVCEFCEKWEDNCHCEPGSKRLLRQNQELLKALRLARAELNNLNRARLVMKIDAAIAKAEAHS